MKAALLVFLDKYKYHFLTWSVFICYEIIIKRIGYGDQTPFKNYIFHYTVNVSIFYLHANFLLKCDLKNRSKVFKYSLIFLIPFELLLFVIFKYAGDSIFYQYIGVKETAGFIIGSRNYYIMSIWRTVLFMGYGTGYYFLKYNQQQKDIVEKLKQQELQQIILDKEIKNELILTQNALLRAQINPHFLINTLSYLYNETRKQTPKAAETILSLTDIMQYALSKEESSGYIKLEKEICLIENFLLLHQTIQPEQTPLKISYNKEALSILFIPLLLMTLTENIIRHNQLNTPLKPAEIKIRYKNSILCIETSNHEPIIEHPDDRDTGLKNIVKRLFLAYGENATFYSNLDTENYFYTCTRVQF